MDAKRIIAKKAVKYIKGHSTVGFGSGSTVNCVLDEITQSGLKKGFSGSSSTSIQLMQKGIFEGSFPKEIIILIDGADQIIGEGDYFIKGGGGALLREKVLWQATKKIIVVAEERKWVKSPDFPLAVEVLPFAHEVVKNQLIELNGVVKAEVRITPQGIPFYTDNGNWILDIHYTKDDLVQINEMAKSIPGVIETGFFQFDNKEIMIITERREVKL